MCSPVEEPGELFKTRSQPAFCRILSAWDTSGDLPHGWELGGSSAQEGPTKAACVRGSRTMVKSAPEQVGRVRGFAEKSGCSATACLWVFAGCEFGISGVEWGHLPQWLAWLPSPSLYYLCTSFMGCRVETGCHSPPAFTDTSQAQDAHPPATQLFVTLEM